MHTYPVIGFILHPGAKVQSMAYLSVFLIFLINHNIGGPAVIDMDGGKTVLVGVSSFGNNPDGFGRVSAAIDWIEEQSCQAVEEFCTTTPPT